MSVYSARKAFCKDAEISIPSLRSPFFEYYIYLLLNQEKLAYYDAFNDLVKQIGESRFLDIRKDFADYVINFIRNCEGFEKFNNTNYTCSDGFENFNNPINLYTTDNVDDYYISIDFVKANFQILTQKVEGLNHLNHYVSLISHCFNGFSKYYLNDLRPHTNLNLMTYLKESKWLRKYIFGNCNPKNQQKLQRLYILDLLKKIYDNTSQLGYAFKSDEIIFKKSDLTNNEDIGSILHEFELETRYQSFYLGQIENTNVFYKKYLINDNVELVNCPAYLYPQYYKFINNQNIHLNDLYFDFEGNVARYTNIDKGLQQFYQLDENGVEWKPISKFNEE